MLSAPALPTHEQALVAWVHRLMVSAQEHQASDLHIEPLADGARLRLRIHGLLEDWLNLPPVWQQRLVSRIKVLAQMDLSERRLPQDGCLLDQTIGPGQIRVASMPTHHGEKLCLRFSDERGIPSLSALGMPPPCLAAVQRALDTPRGLILLTGPTGAGKTTTLYACLQYLNQGERLIATIEDPIERLLPGVMQTAAQPRIGLTQAQILRALLRQDPDVLMVGEIRDAETAQLAVQAAETGHLVLSTVHSADTLQALSRLRHLGIPNYLVSDTVRLILAQRLLRIQQGDRLTRCAIYEHLEMTPLLASAWLSGQPISTLAQCAQRQGWTSLREQGRALVSAHQVQEQELIRVLGPGLATD